jgi:lipopolysaccharide/colanic/teichoic acid biosynthesis glycosyltransferase
LLRWLLSIKILAILQIPISPYYQSWQKRLLDIFIAIGGIIISLPFFILISGLIFITGGWPVLFFQKRMGRHKKVFTLIKFRTMDHDAEKKRNKLLKLNTAPLPMFKIEHDPRFTTIGRLLSKTGLDELPQLWNILSGEMSFVGPRPLPLYEAKKLPSETGSYFRMGNQPQKISLAPNMEKIRRKNIAEWLFD